MVKFSKLDRFLVSNSLVDLWSSVVALALERKLSDHCPIVLKDSVKDFGPRPFRVFDVWMEDVEFDVIVKNAWNKMVYSCNPDSILRDKLKNVKEDLRRWSKRKFNEKEFEVKKM